MSNRLSRFGIETHSTLSLKSPHFQSVVCSEMVEPMSQCYLPYKKHSVSLSFFRRNNRLGEIFTPSSHHNRPTSRDYSGLGPITPPHIALEISLPLSHPVIPFFTQSSSFLLNNELL